MPDIRTPRLILRPLSEEFLAATADGTDESSLGALLGARVPREWAECRGLAARRRDDIRADPAYAEWSLRGMLLRDDDAAAEMVGHIGFHTRPDPEYLAAFAPHGVEVGYTTYEAHRRRGFAREAVLGMLRWAAATHGVPEFVASVAPENAASLALIAGLGFERVGQWVDDEDGVEHVFVLRASALPRE